MKLVLFDCDGTLVDSLAIIQETMARTFRAFGHEAPDEQATRGTVGLTLDVAIAGLLGREDVDHECRDMMGYYRSLFAEVRRDPAMQEKLYDGVAAMLAHLFLQDDILVGAVTGKSRRGLDHDAGGEIGIDNDNALGGEPVGQGGLAAADATGNAHAQHISGSRAAGIR